MLYKVRKFELKPLGILRVITNMQVIKEANLPFPLLKIGLKQGKNFCVLKSFDLMHLKINNRTKFSSIVAQNKETAQKLDKTKVFVSTNKMVFCAWTRINRLVGSIRFRD